MKQDETVEGHYLNARKRLLSVVVAMVSMGCALRRAEGVAVSFSDRNGD